MRVGCRKVHPRYTIRRCRVEKRMAPWLSLLQGGRGDAEQTSGPSTALGSHLARQDSRIAVVLFFFDIL